MLVTAGTGPRAFPGSMTGGREGAVQWVQEPRDQGEILRQYTKADHRLEHQYNPGLMVSRLLQVAMSEPKGPVYLSVPRETAMLPLAGTTRFPTLGQIGLARPAWPDPPSAVYYRRSTPCRSFWCLERSSLTRRAGDPCRYVEIEA